MKPFIVLTVISASLFAFSQTKPSSGEIKGSVTDASGRPISGATVSAVRQETGFTDVVPIRSVKSDSDGAFDLRRLPLGAYKLYSRKDEDSYPDPRDKFYAVDKSDTPEVELTATHSSATAALKFGPPAAVLAGRIIDANTGSAIKAELAFLDAQGNGHSVPVDGDYRILLPPGKDITLMVTAMGSRANRAQVPVAPLKLEPGQHVYMDLAVRE
jgi:hypothetical protein